MILKPNLQEEMQFAKLSNFYIIGYDAPLKIHLQFLNTSKELLVNDNTDQVSW